MNNIINEIINNISDSCLLEKKIQKNILITDYNIKNKNEIFLALNLLIFLMTKNINKLINVFLYSLVIFKFRIK